MDETLNWKETLQECYVCSGNGMVLGYNGDHTLCFKCHGDAIINLDEDENNT